MGAFIDLNGQTFGRLTVVQRSPTHRGRGHGARWICLCTCGRTTRSDGYSLRKGTARSCGCLRQELTGAKLRTHGHSVGGRLTPEYRAWAEMKKRCFNPRLPRYKDWGGRGITVCDRWRHDFAAFLADVGPRPSPEHTLDRIDVNGHYKPGNVRWADRITQNHNRRLMYVCPQCGFHP